MSTAIMEAPVQTRRCQIEEVFHGSFIELLSMAPLNPIVRGLILAITRKMPPLECQTFEALKEWVETSCDKRIRPAAAPTAPGEGVMFPVEFSDREYGRCSYSVRRHGNEEFRLEDEELVEYAQDAIESGGRLDLLVARVMAVIKDCAWDRCDPSMDDYGDYDHDEHDSSDTENGSVSVSRPLVRDRLVAYLQTQHPELWEGLR
jgi:hypothetical protein